MRLNLDHVHGVPINKDLSEVKYKLVLVHVMPTAHEEKCFRLLELRISLFMF